jgi:hypothetical protein
MAPFLCNLLSPSFTHLPYPLPLDDLIVIVKKSERVEATITRPEKILFIYYLKFLDLNRKPAISSFAEERYQFLALCLGSYAPRKRNFLSSGAGT